VLCLQVPVANDLAGVLDDMSKTTNVYSRLFKRFNDGFEKDIPFISPTTGF
jgi:hypothetical protein